MRPLSKSKNTFLLIIIFAFAILLSSIRFYRTPYSASNLDVDPDTVEYVIGAYRIVTNGTYDIVINGNSYPSRYPPFFSLFAIAPTLYLLGLNPGNGTFIILFFCIIGVIAACLIGEKISGHWGAFWASLLVLALPWYLIMSQQIMTDVPCAAIALLLLFFFIKIHTAQHIQPFYFLIVGIMCSLSASFRFLNAAFALPFLFIIFQSNQLRKRMNIISYIILPLVSIFCLLLIYNYITFGHPLKTGYHFWSPSSSGYNDFYSVINGKYIYNNIKCFVKNDNSKYFILIFLLVLLSYNIARGCQTKLIIPLLKSAALFLIIAMTPILIFHLLYFFHTPRFYLPIYVVIAALLGSILGACTFRFPPRIIPFLQLFLVVVILFIRLSQPHSQPFRRLAAENIINNTPKSCIVLSAINPAYLEIMISYLSSSNSRWIVPVSNEVEYASRLLEFNRVKQDILSKYISSGYPCDELTLEGAKKTLHLTFESNETFLSGILKAGIPVYLESTDVKELYLGIIKQRFILKPVASNIFKLYPKE